MWVLVKEAQFSNWRGTAFSHLWIELQNWHCRCECRSTKIIKIVNSRLWKVGMFWIQPKGSRTSHSLRKVRSFVVGSFLQCKEMNLTHLFCKVSWYTSPNLAHVGWAKRCYFSGNHLLIAYCGERSLTCFARDLIKHYSIIEAHFRQLKRSLQLSYPKSSWLQITGHR